MGAVYEAVDTRSDRKRALKVLLPSMLADDDVRARFDREARLTGAIESDHLVEVSDAGVDPETNAPFIAMELLRGQDLESLVRQTGRAAPADVVSLLSQAALALDKTHAAGIVHRDLKPENLFVTRRENGTICLKVLDFGAAKKIAADGSGAGSTRVLGTPLYMPPEQALGRADLGPPVDLYALGHMAYALLVGSHYWREEQRTMDVLPFLMRSSQGSPEPATVRALRAGVCLPPAFDGWFAKATAVEPLARYRTASETIAALGFALGVSQVSPLLPGQGIVPALSTSGAFPSGATPTFTPTDSSTALSVNPERPIRWSVVAGAAAIGLCLAGGVLLTINATQTKPASAAAASERAGGEAASVTTTRVEPSAAAAASTITVEPDQASNAPAGSAPAPSARPVQTTNPRTFVPRPPSSSAKPRPRGEGLF